MFSSYHMKSPCAPFGMSTHHFEDHCCRPPNMLLYNSIPIPPFWWKQLKFVLHHSVRALSCGSCHCISSINILSFFFPSQDMYQSSDLWMPLPFSVSLWIYYFSTSLLSLGEIFKKGNTNENCLSSWTRYHINYIHSYLSL